jgi:hypothetical protein
LDFAQESPVRIDTPSFQEPARIYSHAKSVEK